jgi:outer membrane receptor protein involved in Fe transport
MLMLVAVSAMAGTTGKIAGRVTDNSGTPLVGATVLIVGTSYGAMTDANGEYFIINLQPGTYTLEARMVGMATTTMEDVQVVTDLTTRTDFTLNISTVGETFITVTDQRGMILRDVTSSVQVVSRDEIKTMPVAGIADVVNQQAGATNRGGLHMRGGRTGEVVYLVDGVSQVDPITNVFNSDVPMSSVAETSVISGGFGAEYGNAQSGVINIVTREGGNSYTGEVSVNGNNWEALGMASDWTWSHPGPFREARLNAEGAIGGPEPLTSYLLPAIGVDVPGDARLFVSGEWLQNGGGEDHRYSYWFNDWQDMSSINVKLTYKPTFRTKINLTGYYMDRTAGFGLWQFNRFETPYVDDDSLSPTFGDTLANGRSILYGLPTRYWHNYSVGFGLTQTLSEATFLEFKLNQYQAHFEYRIYNDPYDASDTTGWEFLGQGWSIDDWLNYTPDRTLDNDGFYRGGASRYAWNDTRSTTTTLRADVTSQVNQSHQLKAGIEGKYYDIFDYNVDTASGGNIYIDRYHYFPNSGSAYIQDKMEYRGMIVNAGLRFDYFDANFEEYPADPTNPVNPGTAPGDPDHIINPVSVPVKYHLSPRVGFSHPITERDVLHFTYGHYFQTPRFDRMYAGADFDLAGAYPIVGNPDLDPEETISYEVGVKHQFDEITMIDITGYYKDITGLVDMQRNFYSAVNSYDLFINGDYGNVRGAELSIMRRPSDFWSFSANYAYSVAMGKSSSATQNYIYNWAGWIIPKKESYLDWDQRHVVNANFDYRIPRGEGPTMGDTHFLEGFGLHLQWTFGSGFPYSEANQGTEAPEINNERYPATMSTTLRVNKTFWIGQVSLDFFCWVDNLFNRHNIVTIIDPAWYDADQDGNGEPDHDPTGQLGDPTAYDRHRQIRFGLGVEW